MLVLAFLFCLAINAQSNPTDLVCDNVVLSASQWERKFSTSYKFNGFFKADGDIKFFTSTGQLIFAIPLDGSLWHQYQDANSHQLGDLFLSGAAFGYPGVLILSSRQVSNPMLSGERICQTFLEPSPSNLITSYSELVAHGVGYMESKYFSLEAATYRQVFSNEIFSFDSEGKTAFSQTQTFVLGNGTANHYIAHAASFRYTPITETEAIALGWSGSVATVPLSRGFHVGRGAIPVGILNAEQRALLSL